MKAFVDESGSNRILDPGAYILGAVVVAEPDVDVVRSAMASLRLPGQRKLHWRDERERRQRTIIETLSELPVAAVLAVTVDQSKSPERRRRRVMATLLPELHVMGVDMCEVESRGPKDDARDMRALADLGRSRRFSGTTGPLKMTHTVGPVEPCLWAADAVCGAIVASRTGDHQHVERLGSRLRVINAP